LSRRGQNRVQTPWENKKKRWENWKAPALLRGLTVTARLERVLQGAQKRDNGKSGKNKQKGEQLENQRYQKETSGCLETLARKEGESDLINDF